MMSDCIEGSRATNAQGYHISSIRYGPGPRAVVTVLAHRFAVPGVKQGEVVRHRCDNPGCVNPDHLEVGTQADNIRDAIERGRHGHPPRQTHCIHGHEFTEANTYVRGSTRYCRACKLDRQRIARDRLKSEPPA